MTHCKYTYSLRLIFSVVGTREEKSAFRFWTISFRNLLCADFHSGKQWLFSETENRRPVKAFSGENQSHPLVCPPLSNSVILIVVSRLVGGSVQNLMKADDILTGREKRWREKANGSI